MSDSSGDPTIAFVRSMHPKGKNFRFEKSKKFLNGEAAYVSYVDEDGDEVTDVIYKEGSSIEYFMLPEDVIEKVNERIHLSLPEKVFNSVLTIGGITGLLALIMTVAVVYLAINGKDVPDILQKLILLAFGFYFGNFTKK